MSRFLDALLIAADRIESSPEPPPWWHYGGTEYWQGVRQLMPDVEGFVSEARTSLGIG